MNNLHMARGYLIQAKMALRLARVALEEGNYAYTVRLCQEAVELSLKSALRVVGIEPAKIHDVGSVLKENSHFFPEWFREHISRMASISKELRREREKSMYGDEERMIPPSEIYGEREARGYLASGEFVFQNCKKLLESAVSLSNE